jgi:putative N6-adenine-specific DNA methylase
MRLRAFEAHDFDQLKKELEKAPWRAYLGPGAPVQVKVVCHKSRLWHSGAVKERALEVLRDRAGLVPSTDEGSHVVHLRVAEDEVIVSLEAAGRLHRRGYRTRVEEASLRETLAAGLLHVAMAARQDQPGEGQGDTARGGSLFLWDPFCGAGTIVLEALHMSQGAPIVRPEAPAFTRFRSHDPNEYERFLAEDRNRLSSPSALRGLRILGSDKSSRAIDAARGNYEEAGFAGGEFVVGDVETVAARVPSGAVVVTNPPYGKRLEHAGAVRKLLKVLAARPDLQPVIALVGGGAREALPKSAPALFRTKNGGIPVSARRLR